jgi:ParB family chromosome partitioning protein
MNTPKPSRWTQLPVGDITVDQRVRKRIGALKKLMDSIEAVGILQPIGVHRRPDGSHHLLYGHRRLEAARKVGLTEVPVLIFTGNLSEAEQLTLEHAENVGRRDFTPTEITTILTAIREARAAEAEANRQAGRKAEVKVDVLEETAHATGTSRATVARLAAVQAATEDPNPKVAKAAKAAQADLEAGRIGAREADERVREVRSPSAKVLTRRAVTGAANAVDAHLASSRPILDRLDREAVVSTLRIVKDALRAASGVGGDALDGAATAIDKLQADLWRRPASAEPRLSELVTPTKRTSRKAPAKATKKATKATTRAKAPTPRRGRSTGTS